MNQVKSYPLITVIVAVFNGANKLQHCIDSVSQQTYQNKELIIIDGGSRDGTVDLIKSNNAHINYWISESDKGIYNAWNKGLSQAKGDWICFLGADDYFWDVRVLDQVVSQLAAISPKINVAYGKIMLLSSDGEKLYAIGRPWGTVKNRFKQLMSIPHPGAMHRASLFRKYGNFDEAFRIAGDYEFLLRELKSNDAMFMPNLITIGMRQGGISSDPANAVEAMREIRMAQRMHGQRWPGPVWLAAMARVYVRLFLWRLLGARVANKVLDCVRRLTGPAST
jgi:glycosyltransferase involved in cell wall biosynthesis